MGQELEHLQRVIAQQWFRLTGTEKIVALIIIFPTLYYLAKNSDSYVINTISALLAFGLVAYLVLYVLSQS